MYMSIPLPENLYRFRAVRSPGVDIEHDPTPGVQQQAARLYFFHESVGVRGRRVLDWGCGSGFNLPLLRDFGAVELLGFDLSPEAIALARESYPGLAFNVADACDPTLAIRPGYWDRILSCEVLEHVPDMPNFLSNIRRHLSPDGVAFITTPNRPVFSLGFEPSPINQEHIKELDISEFRDSLSPHFSSITIYGQRFTDSSLLELWKATTAEKIEQLKSGTRWATSQTAAPPFRSRLRRFHMIDAAYHVPALRSAWRWARWTIAPKFKRAAKPPYTFRDFSFVSDDLSDSLWLCAVVQQ
jgi:SAM-dependent methyltransferase